MEAKNIIEKKKSYRWALIVGLSLLVVFGSLNLFVVDKTPADKGPSLSLSIPAILATCLLVPVIEELSYRLWCIRKNVAWNTLIIVLTLAISPHAESHQVETDYFKMTLEPNLWDRKASGGLGTDDTCTMNWALPALTASLLSQHMWDMWDSSSYAMNTMYKSDGNVLNPVYTITLITKKSGQSVFNKTEVDNNHPPAPPPSTPHNFPPASTSSPSPPSNPLPPANCCCNNPNRNTPVSNNTNLTNGTTTPRPIRATCGRNHLLKATLYPGHRPRAHSMYRTGGGPQGLPSLIPHPFNHTAPPLTPATAEEHLCNERKHGGQRADLPLFRTGLTGGVQQQ